MRTYASLAALKDALGIPTATTAQDERLALALVGATAWVDHRLGTEPDTPDETWTGDPDDLAVVTDPDAAYVAATIAAAVRFYKSPEVPFGSAGGLGDMAVYVSRSIPEAEMILLGKRQSWGVG
jgi:hypothetical protein